MPRTERPLDSEDTELGSFAADLRKLRDKAGKPSYRALAARAHYSAATLSDAAGGRKLPSLAVTLAYVRACDGDEQEWEQRWRDIAAPPDPTGDTPYVGLKAFQQEDADRFFGREKLTAKLVDLVANRPLVGVFGASGSGKSSLLRAGLLPRLDHALIFTPGVHPLDECAVRLAQATGDSAVVLRSELTDPAALGLIARQHDLVLVIDQFEEVFTLCGPEQRDWFVQALVTAPHVVIGVRADFYGHIGRHPELVEALEGAQLLVGPMTTDDLRRTITEPAQHVGATVETALVTRLVADVAGQTAALPLVQHALVETWHRRRGMTLSLVGYEEAGGVEHAIARTAEAVYSELTDDQRETARRTFLRLIALGEGTEDTKRRAAREDLDAEVLERLAGARLVTLTEQHAELTHEALIRSWPRLRDWIAEDRNALRIHHQLTEAAAEWDGDRDLLYKGSRLAQAGELSPDSLTEPERAFLTASQADGRRRIRRTRAVMAVLSALVLLLAGTVVFAVDKAQEAAERRDTAVAAAAAGQGRWLLNQDPRKALSIAFAAYRVAPNDENRNLLLGADASIRRVHLRNRPDMDDLRFSKVGGSPFLVAANESASDVRLYEVGPSSYKAHTALPAMPIAMSDDGSRVVLQAGNKIKLLDISDPAQPRTLAEAPGVMGSKVTASGKADVLAGYVTDDRGQEVPTLLKFDGRDRWNEVGLPSVVTSTFPDMKLSPDGNTLAVLRNGYNEVEIVSLADGQYRRVSEFAIKNSYTSPFGFSPDGRFLMLSDSYNAAVEVWDLANLHEPVQRDVLRAPSRSLGQLKFAPDGRHVAVSADRSVRVWELSDQGRADEIASFESFSSQVSALDYWPSTGEFAGMDGDNILVPLNPEINEVMARYCRADDVLLSDEDWAKYFPDVERKPVC